MSGITRRAARVTATQAALLAHVRAAFGNDPTAKTVNGKRDGMKNLERAYAVSYADYAEYLIDTDGVDDAGILDTDDDNTTTIVSDAADATDGS